MTETQVQQPIHVAYSPIASMNYKWTINLHGGYPLIHILPPEEHILSSLHSLCSLKPTMHHLGDDYLCPHKFLRPPEDNGEKLGSRETRNVVEVTEKTDWERVDKFSYILGIGSGKLDKITSYNQHGENLEATATVIDESYDDLYKLRAPIGHQGSLKATSLILKRCKYNVPFEWETGEKTHEPLSVQAADNPVTYASYAKGNGLSHIDGWNRFKHLAKKDKLDLSSVASPKGERGSPFSWTSIFKSPTSSTLCFVNLHLESPIKSSFCVVPHQALSVTLHLQNSIKKLSFVSPSIFLFVSLEFILDLLSLCQFLLLKQTEFLTATPT